MERTIKSLLSRLGEDPEREGLVNTPKRVAEFYREITSGYEAEPDKLFEAVFTSDMDQMVIVKDIVFYSLCEHHMVPFFGVAHIGYIPDGKVLGLSKFARLVELFAARLQIQERLTKQVADAILEHLSPLGVIVVIEARHLCMEMRGVRKPGTQTVTSYAMGVMRENASARNEFLQLIGK